VVRNTSIFSQVSSHRNVVYRPFGQRSDIEPPRSHPTRPSPLPHMHKITDTDDTTPPRDAVTPEARFSRLSRVLSSPELHQHFERNRFIPHSCRRVNVWKLKTVTPVSSRSAVVFFYDVPDTVCTWKLNLLVYRSRGSRCPEILQVP
jgi:hypothetical protein